MNYKVYLAFFRWCFIKVFGGTFNLLESYRYELKRGLGRAIPATLGFILISMICIGVVLLIAACVTESTQTVALAGSIAFWMAIATLFYNIVRAAFECFQDERHELFNVIKGKQ